MEPGFQNGLISHVGLSVPLFRHLKDEGFMTTCQQETVEVHRGNITAFMIPDEIKNRTDEWMQFALSVRQFLEVVPDVAV